MGKYVAKRIGYMALVFLIVSFLMYSLYNLIPTDPARAELEAQKQSLKPAEYEQLYQELRAKMGLDDPLVIRYMRWMGLWPDVGDNNGFNGLLQGNFGYSQFYKKDVTEVIVDPMKNTIFINIFSTILALAITIPLGIFCAVHKGKKVDNTVQVAHFPDFRHEDRGRDLRDQVGRVHRHALPRHPAGHRYDLRVAGRHDPLRPQRDDRRAEHGLHPHRARQGS